MSAAPTPPSRAEFAGYTTGERTLAQRLYPRLGRDELLTADRGFYSWQAWDSAAASGAALLWRPPTQLGLPIVQVLQDGTWLSVVMDSTVRGARREAIVAAARAGHDLEQLPEAGGKNGWPVARLARVIEYDVPDRDGNGTGEVITLISTITEPAQARADELAAAYNGRWEQETAQAQLKTHLCGPGKILRSRLPDLAYQEIWAHLIVQHAIAALITKASAAADLDPDHVSFAKVLRLIRRSATGTADIPPEDWADALPDHLTQIAELTNPDRRDAPAPAPSNAPGITATASRNLASRRASAATRRPRSDYLPSTRAQHDQLKLRGIEPCGVPPASSRGMEWGMYCTNS